MIYGPKDTGDGYAISAYHVWRPGGYDDARAAKYAQRFCDDHLIELRDRINRSERRNISYDDLQQHRRAHGFLCEGCLKSNGRSPTKNGRATTQ